MPSATALTRANDQAIRRALEQAGVEFIDAEKGGPECGCAYRHAEVVFQSRTPTRTAVRLGELIYRSFRWLD